MSLSSRIEELPVEEWAAVVARVTRRVRRRVMRKPARSLGALCGVVVIAAIASNALWEQTAEHPAPMWTKSEPVPGARLVAAHSPTTETVREPVATEPDELVAEIQSRLGEAGYFAGPADGLLNEATREAIALFEADNGLGETGEPSVALLSVFGGEVDAETDVEAVEVASATTGGVPVPPLPALGSIAEVQGALNRAGYGPLTEDGVMGPRTRTALDEFAQSQGMAPTGMTPAILRSLAEATR